MGARQNVKTARTMEINQTSGTQCKLWERAMPATTRNKSNIMGTVQAVGSGHAHDQIQIKHHGHSASCGSGPCPRPETNQASWTQCKLWERAMPMTRDKSSIMDTVQTVGAGHARDQRQIKHHGHSANCGSGPCREPSPPAKATSHPKMDSHPPC